MSIMEVGCTEQPGKLFLTMWHTVPVYGSAGSGRRPYLLLDPCGLWLSRTLPQAP